MYYDLSKDRFVELYKKDKSGTITEEEKRELEYRFEISSCEREGVILRLEKLIRNQNKRR